MPKVPLVATVTSIGPPDVFDWTKKKILFRTKHNYE